MIGIIAASALQIYSIQAQTLDLPKRPADALSGKEVAKRLATLNFAEREEQIVAEILKGNVPDFLRRLRPPRSLDGHALVVSQE